LGVENMRKMMITITSLFILSIVVGQTISALATSEQNLVKIGESDNIIFNKSGYTYEDIEKAMNYTNLPFKFKIPEYVQGEMIVKFKEETSISISQSSNGIISTGIKSIDDLNNEYNVISCEKIAGDSNSPALSNIFKLTLNKNSELFTTAEEYGNDSNVEFAHPNYIVDFYTAQEKIEQDPIPSYIPNDPYFNEQWALDNTGQNGGTPGADIHAPEAWEITKGSSDVVIAIIDTGVDYNHPDLASNIWSNDDEISGNGLDDDDNGYIDDVRGWNFKYNNNDPMDDYGHGTHCAGIASAVIDNGLGIAGVAGYCTIMPLKIYTIEDASKAIKYSVNNGADIISMSFGISDWFKTNQSTIFDLYLDWAHYKGVVEIASAGNDNFDISNSPASNDNVIAVTATDNNDAKAEFSSYGLKSEVAAPGVDIYSTVWQNSPEFGFKSNLLVNQEYFESRAFVFTSIGNVSGQLVYVGLGRPSDLQGINLTGKIALIKRGEIEFGEKVDNVYNKGAIGAIIFNNEPGIFKGTLLEIKQIPAVSISGEDGQVILGLLNQGPVQTNLSVVRNPYEWFSGTSMSCPMVSGVAALLLSKNPDLTPQEVRTILRSCVDPVNSDVYIGIGRINASKAVNKAKHIVAEFDSSLDYSIIDGVFNIKGTTKGLDFNRYVVEYGNYAEVYPSENSWTLIGGSDSRKYNQNLISWDTRNIPDGPYILRLKVFSNNNEVYIDRSFIIIDNVAQTFQIDNDYNENTTGWGYDHFNIIQNAINLSGKKDQIFVHSGTYTSDIDIEHRKITINGENVDDTILECATFTNRGSIKISNFTFKKYGVSGFFSSDNTVSNCKFIGMYGSAMGFLFSSRNVINNNYINNPPVKNKIEVLFGPMSKDNTISNNIVYNNGIVTVFGFDRNVVSNNQLNFLWIFWGAQFNNIFENTISNGSAVDGTGIELYWGRFNNIHDNQISNLDNPDYDSIGILLMSGLKILGIANYGDAAFNTIINNNISDCDVGILLVSAIYQDSQGNIEITKSKYNTISENRISDCEFGIFFIGATNNIIKKNIIKNNNNGVKIVPYLGGSDQIQANDNYIYQNDFIDNTEQAFDNCSNTWYLPILNEGNYWSDYSLKYPDAQVINRLFRPDIYDTPYDIDGGDNKDMYPLVNQNSNSNSNQEIQLNSQTQDLLSLLRFALANKISLLTVIQQNIQTTTSISEEPGSSDVSLIVESDSKDASTTTKVTDISDASDTTSKTSDSDTSDTKTTTDTSSDTEKPSINQNTENNKLTLTTN
jgi:parallel beta-helix repeat protein